VKSIQLRSIEDSLHSLIGISYAEADCWELVKLFYIKILGVNLDVNPTYTQGGEQIEISRIVEIEKAKFTKVDTPKIGDILLLRIMELPTHVGVYVGEGKFLHTVKHMNSCIDTLQRWNTRIVGYYRYAS